MARPHPFVHPFPSNFIRPPAEGTFLNSQVPDDSTPGFRISRPDRNPSASALAIVQVSLSRERGRLTLDSAGTTVAPSAIKRFS
jgi:hypothetical protein